MTTRISHPLLGYDGQDQVIYAEFTLLGNLQQKGNGRQIKKYTRSVQVGDRVYKKTDTRVEKSDAAKQWLNGAACQLPELQEHQFNRLMQGELALTADVYYATERNDLDVSLLLDFLQKRIYRNDRQVRELHLRHFIDRKNPRVECVLVRRPR